MNISKVLKKPLITEKSLNLTEGFKYSFEVNSKASKRAIVDDIVRLYKVDIVDIKTLVVPGKKRRVMGKYKFVRGSNRKKAIVTLKKGQKIDIFPKE